MEELQSLLSFCNKNFNTISLIFIVIGAIFALYQWNASTKLKRAELMKQLSEKIREDPDISWALYNIDYGETHWYDDILNDPTHEIEAKFDKAFSVFNYICYLKEQKIIGNREFRIFSYRLHRMAYNADFYIYAFNLYHFSTKNSSVCSFYYLIKYMERNELFSKHFHDLESQPHDLNF